MRFLLPTLIRFTLLLVLAGFAASGARADADARAQYFNQLLKVPAKSPIDQTIGKRISGVRNVKSVLAGVLYRGGGPGGMVALGESGLRSLCEAGFEKAIYLYEESFTGPRTVSCTGPDGKPSAIRYESGDYLSLGGKRAILADVKSRIEDSSKGPLFVHCWNGYHASGEVAAVALMQFCGFGAAKAQSYWQRNQQGASMISRIAKFQEFADLRVTSDLESAICPK